ncbi:MAG: hypothetical protein U0905_14635 [Pirellulales bacterium]
MTFVGALFLTFLLGVPIVLRFEAIQSQIDVLRQAWPAVASELSKVHRSIEAHIDPSQIPAECQAKHQAFQATNTFDEQLPRGIELIKAWQSSSLQNAFGAISEDDELPQHPALRKYLEEQSKLSTIEDSLLGKVTITLFRLPRTPRLDLSPLSRKE